VFEAYTEIYVEVVVSVDVSVSTVRQYIYQDLTAMHNAISMSQSIRDHPSTGQDYTYQVNHLKVMGKRVSISHTQGVRLGLGETPRGNHAVESPFRPSVYSRVVV
jgi:hypothetical protein